MNDTKFKKENKLAFCTKSPILHLIPYDQKFQIISNIKKECLEIYGEDLISECSLRKVCLGKNCIGRPLPWKSPTALPFLEQLKEKHNITDERLYIEMCSTCPIFNNCKVLCKQVEDYTERDLNFNIKEEQSLVEYWPDVESIAEDNQNNVFSPIENTLLARFGQDSIALDCLSKRNFQIVKLYLYEQKDFRAVAKILGIDNAAYVKYLYYSSLNKIVEFSEMRLVLPKLDSYEYAIIYNIYFLKKDRKVVGKELNISMQALSQQIKRIEIKYKLNLFKFVKKKNNKIIYNIPSYIK